MKDCQIWCDVTWVLILPETNDFKPVEVRSVAGGLFENFMINEIRKQNIYRRFYASVYFWRNTEQKEVDLLLENDNHLYLYEFKWNPFKTPRLTKSYGNLYSNFSYEVVSQENFDSFLTLFVVGFLNELNADETVWSDFHGAEISLFRFPRSFIKNSR